VKVSRADKLVCGREFHRAIVPGKNECCQELCCPALKISELSDVGMPAVVLNDPKMERGSGKSIRSLTNLNRWQRLALEHLTESGGMLLWLYN
jgi:hypothetical protein